MKISIIGTGYVGLITGIGFAKFGHQVTGVDNNVDIVRKLNMGQPTIYEKGLDVIFSEVRDRFRATENLIKAVEETELTIIAVGTPDRDGKIDLKYVEQAASDIGKVLKNKSGYHLVMVKSTVLPGTTDSVILPILKQTSEKNLGEFGLGFNPEFLREGNALEDFMNPDRIVLGADDPKSLEKMKSLYKGWDTDFLETNTRTAEMIKYANNCLLATQISVTNEIANLAAMLGGIDATDVMRGVCLDKRWNPPDSSGKRVNPGILSYLVPGCGFGGSCFPKDVQAIVTQGKKAGLPMDILGSVLKVNHDQPKQVIRLLESGLGDMKGKHIAVLGLAFKPGTDDIRESPALSVIPALIGSGATVTAADPVAFENARKHFRLIPVSVFKDWREAVKDADALAILTSWPEFVNINPDELGTLLKGDLIVDARAILDTNIFDRFRIFRIGCTHKRSC